MSSMRERMPHPIESAPVPLSGSQELTAVRINRRRNGTEHGECEEDCELFQHNPDVKVIATAGLVGMARTANGSTPSIRLDQSTRYRLFQFDGSKPLPYEERVGIALENEVGADVHIAGERPVLLALAARHPEKVRALVAELLAATGEPAPVTDHHEALAAVTEAAAAFQAGVARDIRDGRLDEDHQERARKVVESIHALVGPRVAFYRGKRA